MAGVYIYTHHCSLPVPKPDPILAAMGPPLDEELAKSYAAAFAEEVELQEVSRLLQSCAWCA